MHKHVYENWTKGFLVPIKSKFDIRPFIYISTQLLRALTDLFNYPGHFNFHKTQMNILECAQNQRCICV